MTRGNWPATFFILALTSFFSYSFLLPPPTKGDVNHLVISQIQAAGTSANDEFVEIFNPTSTSVNLTGFRLTRTNSTGSTVQNLIASFSGTLASNHYYLIAHPAYTTISVIPDQVYSASSSGVTTNSTIILYAADHTTVIDKVGFGTATNFETSPAINPSPGQSLSRPNNLDTDNNSVDFAVSASSNPHNASFLDNQITPTPTLTPSPDPTSIPEIAPTPTPTNIPIPTETISPTQIPEPSPTVSPTNTPMPTILPTTTPKTDTHHQDKNHHEIKKIIEFCKEHFSKIHFYDFHHQFFRH